MVGGEVNWMQWNSQSWSSYFCNPGTLWWRVDKKSNNNNNNTLTYIYTVDLLVCQNSCSGSWIQILVTLPVLFNPPVVLWWKQIGRTPVPTALTAYMRVHSFYTAWGSPMICHRCFPGQPWHTVWDVWGSKHACCFLSTALWCVTIRSPSYRKIIEMDNSCSGGGHLHESMRNAR